METLEYFSSLNHLRFSDGDINLYDEEGTMKYLRRYGNWYRVVPDRYVKDSLVDEETRQLLELSLL